MQDCDVTLKALLLESSSMILRHAGVNSPVARWRNVELPRVQNRRLDLLAELENGDLLHIELQTTNDPKMPLRMLEYAMGVWRMEARIPRQLVLYVGNEKLRMTDRVEAMGIRFRYDLLDVRDLDCEALLESDAVSDNILAVLTRTNDRIGTIRRILGKISRLAPGRREDAVRKLLILSGMRGFETVVIEERIRMPVTFDIMDNKVLGPAIRQGIAQGIEQRSREVLRAFLQKRFGALPEWAERTVATCTSDQALELALRTLDAPTIEKVLGASGNN